MDYRYTDRVIGYINRRLIEKFSALKTIIDFDELNILQEVNKTYDDLNRIVRRAFLKIAQQAYKDNIRLRAYKDLDEQWVDELLSGYDPVSKYVFTNEQDRRRARLAEAIIASPTKVQEIISAMKSMSFMYRTYAVRVTDEAALQAFKDNSDNPQIRWIAELDDRTCGVCWERDGNTYSLSELPSKPHLNCRCMFEEVL